MRCCGTVLLARFPLPPPTFTLERRSVHPPYRGPGDLPGVEHALPDLYLRLRRWACVLPEQPDGPALQAGSCWRARQEPPCGLGSPILVTTLQPHHRGTWHWEVLATSLKCQKSRARGEPVILCEALLQVPRARLFPQFGWTFLCLKLFEILS